MIVKPKDMKFDDKRISMIIAGVPGIGKTTLALSAPRPLLIDLDKGIGRVDVKHRKETAVVSSYDELIADLTSNDLSVYDTIVIDTGGKLLEMLKPVVIKENPKNGQRDGTLTLSGFGAVKRKFADFISFINGLDKHLIIVFHATEVALANDVTGLRIRIEGSTKDIVWDDIDIGGFIEMHGNKRTIGFSNCERYYAKGTHGIRGLYDIPVLEKNVKNDFLTRLFEKIQDDLNKGTEELKLYEEVMMLSEEIKKCDNVDKINESYEKVKKATHYLTSKEELWFALNEKAKSLGLVFNKENNKFE